MCAGQRAGGPPLRGDGGGRGKTADPDNQPRQPDPTRGGRARAGMPPRPACVGDLPAEKFSAGCARARRARGAGLSLCGGRQVCRVSHILFGKRGGKTPIILNGGIHPRQPIPTTKRQPPAVDAPRPLHRAGGASNRAGLPALCSSFVGFFFR